MAEEISQEAAAAIGRLYLANIVAATARVGEDVEKVRRTRNWSRSVEKFCEEYKHTIVAIGVFASTSAVVVAVLAYLAGT